VVDFLKRMNTLTQIPLRRLLGWCERYGKANEHNAQVSRDHWM
jgi:hypothetical protein